MRYVYTTLVVVACALSVNTDISLCVRAQIRLPSVASHVVSLNRPLARLGTLCTAPACVAETPWPATLSAYKDSVSHECGGTIYASLYVHSLSDTLSHLCFYISLLSDLSAWCQVARGKIVCTCSFRG